MGKHVFGVEEEMAKLDDAFANAASVEDGVKALQGLVELTDALRPVSMELTPQQRLDDTIWQKPDTLNDIQKEAIAVVKSQLGVPQPPSV